MGNTIPHGDRLHECGPNCPEASQYPATGTKFRHEDGKVCEYVGSPSGEMGWRSEHDYPCQRLHAPDRGEFGMPGIGNRMRELAEMVNVGRMIHMDFPLVPPSEQAERVDSILHEARDLFMRKNAGYGDTGYVLGARGQYADMNRKMGKLKHQLWDGNGDPDNGAGESMEEMLMDLIGHAALTIDYLRMEDNKKEN